MLRRSSDTLCANVCTNRLCSIIYIYIYKDELLNILHHFAASLSKQKWNRDQKNSIREWLLAWSPAKRAPYTRPNPGWLSISSNSLTGKKPSHTSWLPVTQELVSHPWSAEKMHFLTRFLALHPLFFLLFPRPPALPAAAGGSSVENRGFVTVLW